MKAYNELSKEELQSVKRALEAEYEKVKEMGLKLDMSRGKPGKDQLDLSLPLLDVLTSESSFKCEAGVDVRNYGVLDGIPEIKRIIADLMGTTPDHMIVYGNSSLNIMYDTIARSEMFGVLGSTPWCKLDAPVKFLCPVPGYDRHFAITELFGIEMINVPMDENGPDMDMVERLVASDPQIKGIWCVPQYSNPAGIVYSDEVVLRMANLQPAAEDFRIFWDNAYAIHHLYDNAKIVLNIVEACEKSGHPDMYYEFCSTSKVTFPGAGVAAIITSPANVAEIKKQMTIQTIGHDKINQLRHAQYFKNADGVREHMKKQAALLRPKFEAVLTTLDQELSGLNVGTWVRPVGGYFISFMALPGCAKRIVALCKEAGVVMTGAGATYPYGKDPQDANIRIAPTFPSREELEKACKVFVLCVKLASVEKLLAQA